MIKNDKNMRKKVLFTSIMMFSLLVSSCNKNEDIAKEDESRTVEMSFTANFSASDESSSVSSRATIDYEPGSEGVITLEGDETISVFAVGGSGTNYVFKNSPENPSVFTGTLDLQDAEKQKFVAVYPYDSNHRTTINESGTGNIYFNIKDKQIVRDNDVSNNPSFAIYGKNDESVSFYNGAALIRIVFTGSQANLDRIEKLTLKDRRDPTYSVNIIMNASFVENQLSNITYDKRAAGQDATITISPSASDQFKFKIGAEYYVAVRSNQKGDGVYNLYATFNDTGEEKMLFQCPNLGNQGYGVSYKQNTIYTYEIEVPEP